LLANPRKYKPRSLMGSRDHKMSLWVTHRQRKTDGEEVGEVIIGVDISGLENPTGVDRRVSEHGLCARPDR
jgi:hypothetical protein